MRFPPDLFRRNKDGKFVWLEAGEDLKTRKLRLQELSARAPGEYLRFPQRVVHGTSHRYVADRYRTLRALTEEQTHVITLHLGSGCSAAAIRGGRSVDTSMGMTPPEGLVMGSRSGDVNRAIVNLIATKEGLSVLGYENDLSRPVIRFWKDTRHVDVETELAAHAHS